MIAALLTSAIFTAACTSALTSALTVTQPSPSASSPPEIARVTATIETEPVLGNGDAADDPALWIHPSDPSKSVILGADKRAGPDVYDLAGQRLQHLPVGRLNTIDVRQSPPTAGKVAEPALIAGTLRDDNTIIFFEIDPLTRRAERAGGQGDAGPRIHTRLHEIYGLCLYRSAKTGHDFVFANDKSGLVQQWRITRPPVSPLGSSAPWRTELVRTFHVGGQIEGMVADDELGTLFIGEEDIGIWRYPPPIHPRSMPSRSSKPTSGS
jgi:3-phytase